VKFHDGKPFTSADVQFSIMEVLKKVHPRGINTFRDVTAVETPDDFTAVLKLTNAAPYMLAALSGYESPMLPKHVFGQGDIKTPPQRQQPDRHRPVQVR
jgi:peptide/nickel transport system substrate-binding protein